MSSVCVVTLLDGQPVDLQVDGKTKGENIFDDVCAHLDLHEKEYFGLNYTGKEGRKTWLDFGVRVVNVLRRDSLRLNFEFKFYPKEPSRLKQNFTRYLLCLQVRNDILSRKVPCSFGSHALLGSYLVQSQLGDYSVEDYPDVTYLSSFKFCPDPAPGLLEMVMNLHKGHKGLRPAEAEQCYLEHAKKLRMYGVDLYPAKDSTGVDIQLGVCSTGILVHQDSSMINRFAWPIILKISSKRKNFYIKIQLGEYEKTVGFQLENKAAANYFWKVCVDQHTFFRLNWKMWEKPEIDNEEIFMPEPPQSPLVKPKTESTTTTGRDKPRVAQAEVCATTVVNEPPNGEIDNDSNITSEENTPLNGNPENGSLPVKPRHHPTMWGTLKKLFNKNQNGKSEDDKKSNKGGNTNQTENGTGNPSVEPENIYQIIDDDDELNKAIRQATGLDPNDFVEMMQINKSGKN